MKPKATFDALAAVRVGLVAGAAAVLVSLVGMVGTFGKRDIITAIISMGQTLLLIIVFGAGAYAANRTTHGSRQKVLHAALAGATTGAVLAALAVIAGSINLREVLVNASPALVQTLTFNQEQLGVGVLLMLVAGAVIGGVAGLIDLLPARSRRAVLIGLAVTGLLGLLQEIVRITLSTAPAIATLVSWMFGGGGQTGLSIPGAIVTFAFSGGANYWWAERGPRVRERLQALPPERQRTVRWGSWAAAVVILFVLPSLLGSYLSEVANQVGIFILMGLGLNIVVGFAGLLDLGYVAFFAIGAYTMGVLTTTSGQLATAIEFTFWEALPIAVLVSIVAGILLGVPVLKTRGDYLAIVTLGFGEIIRILALSDFLKPYIGGSQGIVSVPSGNIGSIIFNRPQTLYYLIVIGCLLAAFVATRLKDSRIGRAWMAVREDEDVAQAMGIDLVRTKLMAFAVGAAFSGLSGAIFASKLGSIYPHSFALLISINALSLIIVGGMGSVPGVIVGALALVGLPELLREFAEFRLLVYGAVLVAMMLLRPEGLMPEPTRQRELHEDVEWHEDEARVYLKTPGGRD